MTAIETWRDGGWHRGLTFRRWEDAADYLARMRLQAKAAGVTVGRYRLRTIPEVGKVPALKP